MKRMFFLLVTMVMVAGAHAATKAVDTVTVNGVNLVVNDATTVFETDMSEIKSAETVAAYKVTFVSSGVASDWAFITKGADGAYYLSYESVKLRISGTDISPVSQAEYDKVEMDLDVSEETFASVASPMGKAKYKYVWGFDDKNETYIIVYCRS